MREHRSHVDRPLPAGTYTVGIPDQPGKLVLCESCRGIGYQLTEDNTIDWSKPCEDCGTDGVADRTSSNP